MRVRESEICKVRMRESDLVHGLDSARRARLLSEGYKAKSPAAASLAIIHHVGLSDRAELSKNLQGFIVTGCMLRKSTQENIRTVCFVVSRIRPISLFCKTSHWGQCRSVGSEGVEGVCRPQIASGAEAYLTEVVRSQSPGEATDKQLQWVVLLHGEAEDSLRWLLEGHDSGE